MAVKKNQFNMTGVLMAVGGGVAGGLVMDQLEDKVEIFKDKPMLSPLVVSALGLGTIYFLDEKMHGLGYGMLGAAGGELMEMTKDKMEGFSRVNYLNTPSINGYTLNAEEMEDLEEIEEEEGDGMSY